MVLGMVGYRGEDAASGMQSSLTGRGRWIEVGIDMMADREHEADDRRGTQRLDIFFLFRDVAFLEEHR
jgi:hypothetical protein